MTLTPAARATWDDSATVSGLAFTTTALSAPTGITCTGGGLGLAPVIRWTAPTTGPVRNTYLVTYTGTGVGATSGTAAVTGTSWTVPSTLLSLIAGYTISVQTSYFNWLSPASGTTHVSVVLGLGGLFLSSCS
jgi:hypothetical protein